MGYVLDALIEQLLDVAVIDRIIDRPAILAGLYDAHEAQRAELVGDGRLGHSQRTRDLLYAQFPVGEDVEDPQTGDVAQRLEEAGRSGKIVVPGLDLTLMHAGNRRTCRFIGMFEHMNNYSYVVLILKLSPENEKLCHDSISSDNFSLASLFELVEPGIHVSALFAAKSRQGFALFVAVLPLAH